MALFFASVIVIIIWAVAAHYFFPERITFKETLVKAGVTTVLGLVFLGVVYYKNMYDTNIINGSVTGKERVRVSCSHSYNCNCRQVCSGSGNNKSCSEECDTCYEHNYDVDWRVYTTVGNKEIDRVDRQGVDEPKRWSIVKIGEPAANTISYINYVKASPESLFNMKQMDTDAIRFSGLFPNYPEVYDYYRFNRILQMKVHYPQAVELNDNLNNSLRTLGAAKQVNILVVFAKTNDAQYRYALERAWVGGKKNDVIIIMGMLDDTQLGWVDVITFGKNSGNEMLSVLLRDQIKAVAENKQFTNASILSETITKTIEGNFHRKKMQDYEYLKEDFSMSMSAIIGFIVFQIILLTGMTIFFYYYELERGDWASRINSRFIPNYRITRRKF